MSSIKHNTELAIVQAKLDMSIHGLLAVVAVSESMTYLAQQQGRADALKAEFDFWMSFHAYKQPIDFQI